MASVFNFETLFGETLLTKNGTTEGTSSLLSGKVVGLYFSAHWCGPCRGFTPKLAESYSKIVGDGKNFEIVFVSSDQDEQAFLSYYRDMPWLALPFADRDRKGVLSAKYKVRGIPTLILIDPTGAILSSDGRSCIANDPLGAEFPWTPKPFEELIGIEFMSKNGQVTRDAIEGKVLGIYFSAHWCPPCRKFTPVLASVYNKLKAADKNFEVIYVPGDQSSEQFSEYFNEMPWLAIPFGDKRIDPLNSHFEVNGIPHFVIVGADGKVINKSARGNVMSDLEGSKFPWEPTPVQDIGQSTECMGYDINEKKSLIFFMEGVDDLEQDAITAAVEPIARRYADEGKESGDQEILFFTSKGQGGISKQLRALCGLPTEDATATMILVDIPDNGGYYVFNGEITESSILDFVSKQKNGEIASERKQLQG